MHSRSCRDVFLNYLTLVKNDLLRDLKKQLELELSAINMQIISDLFSDCAVIDGHVCMIPVYTRTFQLSVVMLEVCFESHPWVFCQTFLSCPMIFLCLPHTSSSSSMGYRSMGVFHMGWHKVTQANLKLMLAA